MDEDEAPRRQLRERRKRSYVDYVEIGDDDIAAENDQIARKRASKKDTTFSSSPPKKKPTVLQVKHKKKSRKKQDRRAYYSSEEDHFLIIDDPLAHYDSEEYDSDGRICRQREEERKKKEEEQRLQRKLTRKPNTPHLIKRYTPAAVDAAGKIIMPILIRGGLVIQSLGKIVFEKAKFHAKRYIWPVGFKSSREYNSMTKLHARCEYVSEIIDRGDEPGFVVTCMEDPHNPIVIEKPTASGTWAEIAKRFFELKKAATGKSVLTQLSGPEMFGYAHPTVAKIIQEMAGAEKCEKYTMQQFVPVAPKLGEETKRRKPKRKKAVSDSEESSESESSESESESSSERPVAPVKVIADDVGDTEEIVEEEGGTFET